MKIEFKFRHVEHSEELTTHVEGRAERLRKFEMKPTRVEFTFATEHGDARVDVHLRGDHVELHAHATADDFFAAADDVIEKLARQLSRKKARTQSHKASKVS